MRLQTFHLRSNISRASIIYIYTCTVIIFALYRHIFCVMFIHRFCPVMHCTRLECWNASVAGMDIEQLFGGESLLRVKCTSHNTSTGFNGAETSCRMAHSLGILLMNNNCFAIFFTIILVMSVQIFIWKTRRSNHLQMLEQMQHLILNYFRTLSVGPAGNRTRASRTINWHKRRKSLKNTVL